MDGRELPSGENLGPAWYGHSVGEWQGDTLVVNTVGLDERNWIDDDFGHPYSSEARIEERYRRVGPDVIALQFTLYDPKYYTAPWVGDIKPWRRFPTRNGDSLWMVRVVLGSHGGNLCADERE